MLQYTLTMVFTKIFTQNMKCCPWTDLINAILKQSCLMTTLDDLLANLASLNTAIEGVDTKLEEIRTFISSLKAGGVVSQVQLDQISAAVEAAKSATEKLATNVDALDEDTSTPPVEPPTEAGGATPAGFRNR